MSPVYHTDSTTGKPSPVPPQLLKADPPFHDQAAPELVATHNFKDCSPMGMDQAFELKCKLFNSNSKAVEFTPKLVHNKDTHSKTNSDHVKFAPNITHNNATYTDELSELTDRLDELDLDDEKIELGV